MNIKINDWMISMRAIDTIKIIWIKNLKIYKRNYINTVSMWIRPFLFIIPLLLFGMYFINDISDLNFIIISGMLTSVIMSLIIDTNYEINKDVESGTIFSIMMAPISIEAYIWAHALSHGILLNITMIIVILIVGFYKISIIQLIIIIFSLLCITLVSISIALCLSLLTMKLKTFRFSSLITNFILLFSGMLYPVNLLPFPFKFVSFFSPFTYGIDIVRNVSLNKTTLVPLKFELIILFFYTLLVLFISKKLFLNGIDKEEF